MNRVTVTMMYGLLVRDLDAGELEWFTTDRPLDAGAYTCRRHHRSHDCYLAESIPALLLQVGPLIDEAEARAQESMGTRDIAPDTDRRIASGMTDGLLRRLTETSSLWQENPPWAKDLSPRAGQP